MKKTKVDRIFLTLVLTLSILGFFIFTSASLGLLVDGWIGFQNIIIKQIVLGLILGWAGLLISSKINYKKWDNFSLVIFALSVLLSLLVFVPGIGFSFGGAKRWVDIGITTFQPSEIMKFGFVIFYASYLVRVKEKIQTIRYGFLPTLCLISVPTLILLKQPDMGTLFGIICACLAMFLIAGGKKGHFVLFLILGVVMVASMAYFKPYALARLKTFLDPMKDPLGAGYQIRQSLIAIGSGGLTGRGFGQSIQKFSFLPEAIGDSIFAVLAEEFGFLGSSIVVIIFLFFGLRGYKIACQTKDMYGILLATGIVTLVLSQSFINIGAMLSILPLTGVPLIFLSHGGTSLLMTLFEMGIVLNISKR